MAKLFLHWEIARDILCRGKFFNSKILWPVYTFDKFFRTGSTIAVKSDQLGGNADTFMSIFSADPFGFAVAI